MTTQKDLRIVINRPADVEAFKRAKAQAERELGISLKDNEFARRVVVQGVRGKV